MEVKYKLPKEINEIQHSVKFKTKIQRNLFVISTKQKYQTVETQQRMTEWIGLADKDFEISNIIFGIGSRKVVKGNMNIVRSKMEVIEIPTLYFQDNV